MNNSLADSKTLTRLLLICLAVILGLCLILGDGDDDATAVFNQVYAIKRVETDENIYAVCADCGRGTNVKDAVSLVNTATSLGIKICLFIVNEHNAGIATKAAAHTPINLKLFVARILYFSSCFSAF